MKIDFRGTYDSLARVVNHRPRPVESNDEFAKVLGQTSTSQQAKANALHLQHPLKAPSESEPKPRIGNDILLDKRAVSHESFPTVEASLGKSNKIAFIENEQALIGKLQPQKEKVAPQPIAKKETNTIVPTIDPTSYQSTIVPKTEFRDIAREIIASSAPTSTLVSSLSSATTKTVAPKFSEASLVRPKEDKAPSFGEIKEAIKSAGQKHGIDPVLGLAVAHAESKFDYKAVSKDGHESKGLFQLLDKTGKDLLARQGKDPSAYDPFNFKMNTDIGIGYLRYLHDIFANPVALTPKRSTFGSDGNQSLEQFAVASFNAGEGRVASAQERAHKAGVDPKSFADVVGFLPQTTQAYVARVMAEKADLEEVE